MSALCPTCGHMPDTPAHELGCRDELTSEQRAKLMAADISSCIGWQGAQPHFIQNGYTGAVVLTARASVEVAKRLEATRELKRTLRADVDEMRAKLGKVERRYQSDLRVTLETTERLLMRLP